MDRYRGTKTELWRSQRQDDNQQDGVALIIASKDANTQLQWKPIYKRIFSVRLDARHVRLSIIVAYALIECADEEVMDDLCYSLQMIVSDVPRHDDLLLLGDLNARVGCNINKRERVMGKYGVGDLTDNR